MNSQEARYKAYIKTVNKDGRSRLVKLIDAYRSKDIILNVPVNEDYRRRYNGSR